MTALTEQARIELEEIINTIKITNNFDVFYNNKMKFYRDCLNYDRKEIKPYEDRVYKAVRTYERRYGTTKESAGYMRK